MEVTTSNALARFRKLLAKNSPIIMGVMNITPDSFSDGFTWRTSQEKLDFVKCQVAKMVSAGVDIIDVGGESTRPNAPKIEADEETDRIIDAIATIRQMTDTLISVDTYKPEVMTSVANLGVDMFNDISGTTNLATQNLLAELKMPVCIMHMRGTPSTMQQLAKYDDVVQEVKQFLSIQANALIANGLPKECIVIDPGFGFAKNYEQNVELFKNLKSFAELDFPLLVGVSRKSMLGTITGKEDPKDRVTASVVAGVLAIQQGARIVRVHDVEQMQDGIKVLKSLSC